MGGALWLRVSDLAAVNFISALAVFLHCSPTAYLNGMGFYLGFVWKDELNVGAPISNNQTTFAFSIVSIS